VVALALLMKIEDLLSDADRRRFAAQPEMDPRTESAALQEAQLMDVRVHALTSTVGLLRPPDRPAVHGGQHGATDRAWTSGVRVFSIRLGFVPDARLTVAADSAEFYVGDVDVIGDTPPDYGGADDAVIRAGLADWSSPFSPVHAVFLDPAPAGN
jgi:hypothetical protein